jgi:hypothetical protein
MKSTDVKSLRAIPDAPTFYPSEAEFKDLYAYLQKIHTEGVRNERCKFYS